MKKFLGTSYAKSSVCKDLIIVSENREKKINDSPFIKKMLSLAICQFLENFLF